MPDTSSSTDVWVRLERAMLALRAAARELEDEPWASIAYALRCVECGTTSEGRARGWRALLTDDEDGEPETAAIYCPSCSEAEFHA